MERTKQKGVGGADTLGSKAPWCPGRQLGEALHTGCILLYTEPLWHYRQMREKIFQSFMSSLEWRLYAFFITSIFLWIMTGHLAESTLQALGLQIILFIGHLTWYYFRSNGVHHFTLNALATRLGDYFYYSLIGRGKE